MKLSKECFENIINCIIENTDMSPETINENGCIKIGEFTPFSVSLKEIFNKASVAHDIKEIKFVLHILRDSGIIDFQTPKTEEGCEKIFFTKQGYAMLFNHYYQH